MAKPETLFIVRGRGPFPLDMLRYDRCYPVDSIDAQVMTESILDGYDGVLHTVALYTRPNSWPTAERWASFGYTVAWVDMDHPSSYSVSMARDMVRAGEPMGAPA